MKNFDTLSDAERRKLIGQDVIVGELRPDPTIYTVTSTVESAELREYAARVHATGRTAIIMGLGENARFQVALRPPLVIAGVEYTHGTFWPDELGL